MIFQRRSRELTVRVPEIHHVHKVEHMHTKAPEPVPVRVWLSFRDLNGNIIQTLPQRVYNKSAMMNEISLGLITRRDEDLSIPLQIEVQFVYNNG